MRHEKAKTYAFKTIIDRLMAIAVHIPKMYEVNTYISSDLYYRP
jgi:hypothetical protein